ncbi:septum formation family protein [Dactylosporangium matsuzakiense]|uniref:Septum formation-related domain-containing protein n=1 Tax=Dactylosporangium matsuzakiense TaxID=53360 RepID=A0A9W6NT71_9ACTN|nr:septum formation family protein [Dactylosporangium matsuzakiense]UWZ41330.1 hypothetical protein Dmats_27040 [Dactylosporangium matsuzakiense]GLL07887.1 hypothetical protein GCM10017581_096460 [Dactylosporangium matsuzakiense]
MAGSIEAAMRELAGPDLYRRNAFRITGLRTDAERRAVRDARQKLTTLLKVGADTGLDADLDTATAAFDLILGDPRPRLVHELFWLWDEPGATCTCTAALHRDHDAAVRAHSQVLEAEQATRLPTPLERRRLDEQWTKAGNLWHQQARRAAVWNHLRERIAALDDRQLDEADIDALRDGLPTTLVRPLIQLAAAGGGRQADLSRLAHAWPATTAFVADELEKAAEPLYEQIRTEVRTVSERLDAGTKPQMVVQRLRKQLMPKVERLEGLVPAAQHRRTARLRNEVATAFNNCAVRLIDSLGAASDKDARSWLKQARKLVSDPNTEAKIDDNLAYLADLVAAQRLTPAPGKRGPQRRADDAERINELLRLVEEMEQRRRVQPRPPQVPRSRPARPYTYRRRRPNYGRYVWLVLIAAFIGWAVYQCDSSSGDDAGGQSTVSVGADTIAGNAPAGTCLLSRKDWRSRSGALTSTPCDREHRAEVLGYVPLGEPGPYPGDEVLAQTTQFECSFLLAGNGLSASEYAADGGYTGEATWNTGGRAAENYATCLVGRPGDKPMPTRSIVDPLRTSQTGLTLPASMFAFDVALDPPPGSCIADKASYDKNDGSADFVRCGQPHWGEILGYPVLYEPDVAWPGDRAVSAAADAACRALYDKRRPGPAYQYLARPPGSGYWSQNTRAKYTVCVLAKVGDQPWSGAAA